MQNTDFLIVEMMNFSIRELSVAKSEGKTAKEIPVTTHLTE
jgi:hypothetical protein